MVVIALPEQMVCALGVAIALGDADGRVVETEVVRGSGSKVLDRRAVAIVTAAAPYGRFNAAMRKNADQLVITSRFRFTRDENLETTLSAQ